MRAQPDAGASNFSLKLPLPPLCHPWHPQMLGLLLLQLLLCARAASGSGHSIAGGLARRTDHSTTTGVLWSSSTGLRSLHRRALSVDLNETPTHDIDLNEMPDSDGEPGHHAEGVSLHTGGQASPRQPQRHLSRPVTPSSARESLGQPSSVPWLAWSGRKSRTSARLLPSTHTDALLMHVHGDAGSSTHVGALSAGMEADDQRTSRKPWSYYHARRKEKRKLLGYKRREKFRQSDKNRKLEEVVASLNNQPYTPTTNRRTRAEYDARYAEKKRVLGYKRSENLRDEHKNKGLTLEVIKRRQGMDPSVSVPSERPWKKRKDGRKLDSHGDSSGGIAVATRDAQKKAWDAIADSILARPGKQTRTGSHQR